MSAQEDRNKLSSHLTNLKAKFDAANIASLGDREQIEWLLDELVDAEVRIKQFKDERGVGDWNGWGPPLWNDLERNQVVLERKLSRIQIAELRNLEQGNQKRSFWSVFWAAIAALAAMASAYFAYKSLKS